ncbi:MAG: YgfZ/GcvT domain-containing protein [Bryobacteraceae bacterium]
MNGYEELRTAAAWIDLSARGKIRITGEDRARLVHAMCTNHVKNLQPGDGLYAFFLNEKGRIFADAYIYNFGESYLIDTEPEVKQKLFDHLDRYIIADDAVPEDETEKWDVVAIEGPKAAEVAASLGIAVSEKQYAVAPWEAGFIARVHSAGIDGVRIFVPAVARQNLLDRLAGFQIPQADAEAARTVRIENAIPRYGDEITERYLVQETGQMHAVHCSKGCYLGQEIVERVRSRGQVHRVLMPVRIKTNTPPEPGTRLTARGADAAEIASAVYSPAHGEVAALAYVRTEVQCEKPVLIVKGSEPPVEAVL